MKTELEKSFSTTNTAVKSLLYSIQERSKVL